MLTLTDLCAPRSPVEISSQDPGARWCIALGFVRLWVPLLLRTEYRLDTRQGILRAPENRRIQCGFPFSKPMAFTVAPAVPRFPLEISSPRSWCSMVHSYRFCSTLGPTLSLRTEYRLDTQQGRIRESKYRRIQSGFPFSKPVAFTVTSALPVIPGVLRGCVRSSNPSGIMQSSRVGDPPGIRQLKFLALRHPLR